MGSHLIDEQCFRTLPRNWSGYRKNFRPLFMMAVQMESFLTNSSFLRIRWMLYLDMENNLRHLSRYGRKHSLDSKYVCPKLSLAHKPLLLQRYLAHLDTSILWVTLYGGMANWRWNGMAEYSKTRNWENILAWSVFDLSRTDKKSRGKE